MQVAFYINQVALTDLINQPGFNREAFCYSLLEGDCKNDKQPREVNVIRIIASNQDKQLVEIIEEDLCLLTAKVGHAEQTDSKIVNTVYLIGFASLHAEELGKLKLRRSFKLIAVNKPGQRHPAALVAIADGLKRIRNHHIFWAVNNPDYAPNVDVTFLEQMQ